MAEPSPTEVLRTLVISDLVASTALTEKLGDVRAAEVFARHDRVARDLLQSYEGREIDRSDGFLLLFRRPISALRFALDYHRALAGLGAELDVELRARVGIHLGEVVLRRNPEQDVARGAKPLEVEGIAKPLAGRLMSLAVGGQTLLTRAAFDFARQSGAQGRREAEKLRWLAHGSYVFKGLEDPVEIFEVGDEGGAPLRPPAPSEKAEPLGAQLQVLGWRPAPHLEIPSRPNWQVERKLGEGGFGETWLAHHKKTHAPRVFKFCYDKKSLSSLQREITLFRLLKEELGERDDIGRILDWSFDEAPYFIEAEYSEAGSLNQWAAEQGGVGAVALATRLEIVAQVADALAAAHSVGVLHKDVKPDNVLIGTGTSGNPRAVLIDFGVGAITDRRRLEEVGITVLGLTVTTDETPSSYAGTRLYMAPELLEGKAATLQADIFALGVLLYQLVVGDLSRALAPGWRRDVEDELLKEDIDAAVDGVPAKRLADAHQLAERLRSLPERRQLRRDQLRREEAAQRAREALKRSQRRRRVMTVAMAVLALFAVTMAVQARRITREAERANREAEAARQVSGFLVDLFSSADPDETGGEEVTVRELLDRGAQRIDVDLATQPEIRARLLQTMARVYDRIGSHRAAAQKATLALEISRRLHGGDPPALAESLGLLAAASGNLGNFDEAEALHLEALALRRRHFGSRHVEVAAGLDSLGELLRRKGKPSEAETTLREAVAIFEELRLGDDRRWANALSTLARILREKGEYGEARPLYLRALAMQRRLHAGPHHDVADVIEEYASLLVQLERYGEAETLYQESLTIARQLFGAQDNPDAIGSLNGLGEVSFLRGEYQDSEGFFRRALEMRRRLYGEGHPEIATGLNNLGIVLQRQGRLEEAETLLRETISIDRRRLAEDHPELATSLHNLAQLLLRMDRPMDAEALYAEAVEIYRQAYPEGHWKQMRSQAGLAKCLMARGSFQEAEALLLEGHGFLRQTQGEAATPTRETADDLVALYEAWGRPEQAARYRASPAPGAD